MQTFELDFIQSNSLQVGLDEAGRGPLAGAVVAAAVIFPINLDLRKAGLGELNDSKKLTEHKRNSLFPVITREALAWSVAWSDREEIDSINILQASLLAMRRCLLALPFTASQVLVDGNKLPRLPQAWKHADGHAIIKGDSKVPVISAASVLAKVTRDKMCLDMHENYPDYGFAQHKGYPTKAHLAMLRECGPCPQHRQSFAPLKHS
ncbi:MAG: ribonuclease HII [Gammaproteobacteria bacterium]|nr:ribonuclease HII [Gammaproteobacteria bacterium]NNM13663.1 ribonuclease HII [Gammaproteobacteria bacterium]